MALPKLGRDPSATRLLVTSASNTEFDLELLRRPGRFPRSPEANRLAGAAQFAYIEMPNGTLVRAAISNLKVYYDEERLGYFGDDIRAGEQRVPRQPMRIELEAIVVTDYGVVPESDKQELMQAAREQRAKKTGVVATTPPKPEPKSPTARRFADLEPETGTKNR